MRRRLLLSILFLFALIASACGSASPIPSGTLAPQAATVIGTAIVPITGDTTATADAPALVKTAESPNLGPYLVDAKGMTLYMYTMDSTNTSTCYDACAAVWPPVLTEGAPLAGSGVKGNLLSTTTRIDGATQVTYNGHPLYYFAKDKTVGDTTGESVQNVWYVITPDGNQK